jgi:very-short-patch-repair endonuclease
VPTPPVPPRVRRPTDRRGARRDGISDWHLRHRDTVRSVMVEFDGEVHRNRRTFVDDLRRQNDLVLAGWTVLRSSSADVLGGPQWGITMIRAALGRS